MDGMPLIPRGRADLDLNFASVYWTHEDLFGTRMAEQGVIELLKQLAVEDCVEALSRLSCLLDTKTAIDADRQRLVIDVMQFARRSRMISARG
jgi:hypothetical protein